MEQYRMYIDGESTDSVSGRWMDSENPFSGEVWAKVAQGSAEDTGPAAQAAHQAFTQGPWGQLTASQRGLLLHKVGDRQIAQAAAKDFKRVVLELDGKSPNIVFEDVDLDAVAHGATTVIPNVCGQSC